MAADAPPRYEDVKWPDDNQPAPSAPPYNFTLPSPIRSTLPNPTSLMLPSPTSLTLPSPETCTIPPEQSFKLSPRGSKKSASITTEFSNVSKMKIWKEGVLGTYYFGDNHMECQGFAWRLLATHQVWEGEIFLGLYLDSRLHQFQPRERYSVDLKMTLINRERGKSGNFSKKRKHIPYAATDSRQGATSNSWGWPNVVPFKQLTPGGFAVEDTVIVQCKFTATRC